MTALVQITPSTELGLPELKFENQQITCSSLDVANHFEKQHKNVLQSIRNLECSEEFNALNFEGVEYKDEKGELRESYKITRDGFTFLAMGFTGKKAAAWKEAYINAFNQMEKRLQHIFDPMVIEYRKQQINQIEQLVIRIENTVHPSHWEISEILKVMVLQFSRELLLACQDKVMLEDRTKALQEVGLSIESKKVDHPTVILFWDQIRKIGLPLVNRSVEDGLMCISPRWYFHWCKTLGMKPVAKEQELDDTFGKSVDLRYLGKQFRSGPGKPDFCWYFANSLQCQWIKEHKELGEKHFKAQHKNPVKDDIAELINGEDA